MNGPMLQRSGRRPADVGFTRHRFLSAQVGQGRLAAARPSAERLRLTEMERCKSLEGGLLPALLLLTQRVEQRAALVERIERAGGRGELDHLVQLFPGGAGAAGGG